MAARAWRLLPSAVALLVCLGVVTPASQAQSPPDDLRIILERTPCAGECPVYTVTLDARGRVTYEGRAHVRLRGVQTRQVAAEQVHELLREAERLGFFEAADGNAAASGPPRVQLIDVPTTILSITRDGRTRRIQGTHGDDGPLAALERQVERVARTRPWIRLDAETLRELVREHQRPAAGELQRELRIALEYDDVEVIRALLDVGADANAVAEGVDAPMLLLAQSPAAAQLLIDAGAAPFATTAAGLSALWTATMKSPGQVRVLLQAGVPVDHPADEDGHTALWLAACHGNIETVSLLLGEGANPAVRFDGISPADCARQAQARRREEGPSPLDGPPPFVQDFAATITRLERAVAGLSAPSRP